MVCEKYLVIGVGTNLGFRDRTLVLGAAYFRRNYQDKIKAQGNNDCDEVNEVVSE